jgi:2-phospho-L-lactate guanylyltransferase
MASSERARTRAVVVIPIKSFDAAKHRLSSVLAADERAELARELATRVVRAAHDLPVVVVCDDDDVARWGESVGATVLRQRAQGLNGAVTDGVESVGHDYDEVIVAHADLPRATDLRLVRGFDGITIVPDRHRDGTNVICLPVASGFRFAYGAGSFARHRAEAARLRVPLRVLTDDALGWDIDTPADLHDFDGRLGSPFDD